MKSIYKKLGISSYLIGGSLYTLGLKSSYNNSFGTSSESLGTPVNESNFSLKDSSATFNDTNYDSQEQFFEFLNLDKALKENDDASNITIGVLDTGVTSENKDLKGVVDTSLSVDYASVHEIKGGTDIHGTCVAGIIGAIKNNNFLITGIASNVKIVSIRIFNGDRHTADDPALIAKGINYAKSIGCDILNISGGFYKSYFSSKELSELSQAITNFKNLIVCSAGNENLDIDENKFYPASFEHDNILTVGGLNSSLDGRWSESNYGYNSVDIYAPGQGVISLDTAEDNYRKNLDGTSYSSPFITGVAAIYLKSHPNAFALSIKNAIIEKGEEMLSLDGSSSSRKYLNAYNVLRLPCKHEFSYTWLNYKQHVSTCNKCGFSSTIGHVVSGGELENGNRYATCLDCGGLAEMGFVEASNYTLKSNGLYYPIETYYFNQILDLSYEDSLSYLMEEEYA